MTNLQAIQIEFPNLSEDELKNNLELWGINPDDDYKPNDRKYFWVVFNIVGRSLFNGVTNVSEGGYSIGYDRNAWLDWYNLLADRFGFPRHDTFGKIENMTNRW